MAYSIEQISDRMEIEDLIWRYSELIDQQNFDGLREEIFTEDAFIDYSVYGGSKGDLEGTISFLKEAMPIFSNTQHLNANIQVKLNGDTATGKVMCFNPQEMKLGEDNFHTFFLGLWYIDEYVRTDAGWRIKRRVEEASWKFNTPDFMDL